MSDRSVLPRQFSLSAMLPFIRFAYGFGLAAILTKYLTVEAYGNWSLFISLTGLILTCASLNLMYASNVMLPGKDRTEQRREMFSVGLTRFAATILVYGLAVGFLAYYDVLASPLLLLLLAALILRTACDLCFGFLRALLLLRRQVLFLATESTLIIIGLLLGCYVFNGGLYGAVYAFLAAEFVAAGLGMYLLRDFIVPAGIDYGALKKYLAIGLPLIPFAFSDLIVNALVPLLIKLYDSIEAVAFYSIAQKVALVATVPTAIVNNIYAQHLRQSRLNPGGSGVRRTFLLFFSVYMSMALPLLVLLYFFGDDVIRLISTAEYVRSHELMLLLVIVNILVSIGSMLTTIFAVYERTRTVGWVWLGVLLLFLLVGRYCYDRWEVPGVAYALIGTFGLGVLVIGAGVLKLRRSIRLSRISGPHEQ